MAETVALGDAPMTDSSSPRGRRLSRRGLLASLAAVSAAAAVIDDRAHGQVVAARPVSLAPAGGHPIEVTAKAIGGFDRTNPLNSRFGRLEFLGGLVLSSEAREFGGWSGLVLDDAGRKMMAISDEGSWLTADLSYDGNKPRGLKNAVLGPIVGSGGRPLDRKRDLDAESITMLDGTPTRGTVLIAFERNHRIGRFPVTESGLGPPLGYLKLPAEERRMRSNAGFESVGVIRGGPAKGSIIAFAEDFQDAQRNHTGWIWPGGIGGEPQRVGLVNIGDYAITDVSSLADGSLIVLERKFRWTEGVHMRLRLVPAVSVKPGALLDGDVLLDASMASEIDNMEGLALHKGARGETVLTLISDDNFNHFLQRTILLQFALHSSAKT